ncbi:MAG TPA: hypothetical protein VK459_06735 [Polyangiaceae bacterium]|jgi:hypothetical protein|nr:hypothetical protein [Polyangiaceae bacterium]
MKRAPQKKDPPQVFAHLSQRLAVRADGAILLSTKDLGDRKLEGCEVETYVTLPAEQAAFARGCLAECVAEGSAKLVNAFPKKGKSAGGSTKKARVDTTEVDRDKRRSA